VSTPDLRDAARHFFREPHCFSASGGSSGLSGSSFARVDVRDTSWCLRAWPADFREGRLRFIHRALLRSRADGFSSVPPLALTNEGDTVLDLDGRLFDAQEWLTGQPLSGRPVWDRPMPNVVQSLQPRMLASLTAATARFHRSTTGFKAEGEDEKKPLLVQLTEVARDAEARREVLLTEVRVRTEDGDRRVALRWLELLPAAIAPAETTLRDRPVCASSVSTVCHGDLWAPHVHFDGTTFVGFTDFGSLHLGSPAVDLAQLILHFNGWSARYAVVDAYCKVSSLGEDEAELPAAAMVDLAW
jgi:Ser/Thr protein kinase RdoA (MazF antagonist)